MSYTECFSFVCPVVTSFLSELGSIRSEFLAYLTHILLGDALAAEYLLLHLVSNVYVHFCFCLSLDQLEKRPVSLKGGQNSIVCCE